MGNSIITRLVKIGNSQGVRIPKVLLEHVGLTGDLQIEVDGNRLILSATSNSRHGWEEHFARMAKSGDDILLDGEVHVPTVWEESEWEW